MVIRQNSGKMNTTISRNYLTDDDDEDDDDDDHCENGW